MDDRDEAHGELNQNADPVSAAGGERHVDTADLLLYALGLLPPGEVAAIKAHLEGVGVGGGEGAGCAECQQEMAEVQQDMGVYVLGTVPMDDPPERSRARLLEEIGQAGRSAEGEGMLPFVVGRKAEPAGAVAGAGAAAPVRGIAAEPRTGARGRGVGNLAARTASTGWTGWAGWAVAAAMALTALHFYQGSRAMRETHAGQSQQLADLSADEARARQTVVRLSAEQARARQIVEALGDSTAQRVVLTRTPAQAEPTGRATYVARSGTLIFLASHLAPLPAAKTYELWVLPANGSAPVAAGTFRPDERGDASMVAAGLTPGVTAKGFGVTVEPAGGSAAPTMPIVLSGS
ncbi:MAG TPA: anti-sigma factor [Acidobacteriaceae bacterium]